MREEVSYLMQLSGESIPKSTTSCRMGDPRKDCIVFLQSFIIVFNWLFSPRKAGCGEERNVG